MINLELGITINCMTVVCVPTQMPYINVFVGNCLTTKWNPPAMKQWAIINSELGTMCKEGLLVLPDLKSLKVPAHCGLEK